MASIGLTRDRQRFVRRKMRQTELGVGGGKCDQIGRFFDVIGDNFSLKSSPNICPLFGLPLKTSFCWKNSSKHFEELFD